MPAGGRLPPALPSRCSGDPTLVEGVGEPGGSAFICVLPPAGPSLSCRRPPPSPLTPANAPRHGAGLTAAPRTGLPAPGWGSERSEPRPRTWRCQRRRCSGPRSRSGATRCATLLKLSGRQQRRRAAAGALFASCGSRAWRACRLGQPPQPTFTRLPCADMCRRPVVEHTSGICRVVPPADWVAGLATEFAIDRGALKFNARVQRVDQLQRKHTAVASQRFWNEYQAWMAANGVKRKGGKLNPVFNGREIELDRFHAAVAHRGGYAAVTEDRGWREIANVLDVSTHTHVVGVLCWVGSDCCCWALCCAVQTDACCMHICQLPQASCNELLKQRAAASTASQLPLCPHLPCSRCPSAPLLPAAGGQAGQCRLCGPQAVREGVLAIPGASPPAPNSWHATGSLSVCGTAAAVGPYCTRRQPAHQDVCSLPKPASQPLTPACSCCCRLTTTAASGRRAVLGCWVSGLEAGPAVHC